MKSQFKLACEAWKLHVYNQGTVFTGAFRIIIVSDNIFGSHRFDLTSKGPCQPLQKCDLMQNGSSRCKESLRSLQELGKEALVVLLRCVSCYFVSTPQQIATQHSSTKKVYFGRTWREPPRTRSISRSITVCRWVSTPDVNHLCELSMWKLGKSPSNLS